MHGFQKALAKTTLLFSSALETRSGCFFYRIDPSHVSSSSFSELVNFPQDYDLFERILYSQVAKAILIFTCLLLKRVRVLFDLASVYLPSWQSTISVKLSSNPVLQMNQFFSLLAFFAVQLSYPYTAIREMIFGSH